VLALAALTLAAAWKLYRYRLRAAVLGPDLARAVAVLRGWSRTAWRHLGLDVHVEGAVPADAVVYVANHRSYLDIPLLSGVLGATFVSRADVADWTLVGAAARAAGVVFVARDDLRGRIRAARALARRLRAGSVVVFAEGTTTGGRLPAAFHAGLFRLLHHLRVPVVPVTVRYGDRRAYWVDDVSLGAHLLHRVLAEPRLGATVHVGPALEPRRFTDAEELRRAAYAAVCRPLEEHGELA
jgi:1-acyl-sn-glycerol-3-phosphate acyltransferase